MTLELTSKKEVGIDQLLVMISLIYDEYGAVENTALYSLIEKEFDIDLDPVDMATAMAIYRFESCDTDMMLRYKNAGL